MVSWWYVVLKLTTRTEVQLQHCQIKFVYKGHRVKVKITGVKKRAWCASLCNLKQVNPGSRWLCTQCGVRNDSVG